MLSSLPIDRVEAYRLRRPLGAGGMALVFEAVHEILGTEVAIKLAAPHVCRDPTLRARFLNEARALIKIDHPRVIHATGCGQIVTEDDAPILYIIMELLRGRTLRDRLAAGPLSIDEARQIGLQVAEAMCEVQRHGLVHRDLKPENIMLLEDGAAERQLRVKVIDFGIAKVPASAQKTDSLAPITQLETSDDASLGTPGYMSPEQCVDASATSAQSDAYALGVVLYEMLSGHPPFQAATRVELLTQHIRDSPPPLRREKGAVPPKLRKLAMSLLEKSPSARPTLDQARKVLRLPIQEASILRRRLLAGMGLATFLVGVISAGRVPFAHWIVARELRNVQLESGTVQEAQQAVARARQWVSILSVGNPDSLLLAQARIFQKEADIAQQEGRLSISKERFTRALTQYDAVLHQHPGREAIRDHIASSSNELAQVFRHLGQDEAAAEYFRRGIAEHDILVRLPDQLDRRRYLRTLPLYRRAELAAEVGDPQAAALFSEVHQTLESLYAAAPHNPSICWHLSRVLVTEAALWARSGRGATARIQAERALHLVQEARRLAPNWKRPKIAEVEEVRSTIYEALGELEEAKAALHAAFSRWQETVAEEPRGVYRHAWLLVCIRGAQLQKGSLRDSYFQTASRLIQEFDQDGIYQGDIHVERARAWLQAQGVSASPQDLGASGGPPPVQ